MLSPASEREELAGVQHAERSLGHDSCRPNQVGTPHGGFLKTSAAFFLRGFRRDVARDTLKSVSIIIKDAFPTPERNFPFFTSSDRVDYVIAGGRFGRCDRVAALGCPEFGG